MTGDHRQDLELALNKNRGNRLLADWSRRLSRACGVEISASSFLSIEMTKKLKTAFFAKIKHASGALRANWKKQDQADLLAHLLDVCVAVGALRVVLFSKLDHFVGGVYLPADCVLRNAMFIWTVVEEDLGLATEDLQHGFCLEENFYTPAGDYVAEGTYELTAWGAFVTAKGSSTRA